MLATERADLEKEKESTAKLELGDATLDAKGSSVASPEAQLVDPLEDSSPEFPGISFLETHNRASSVAAASRARLSSWLQR